MNNTGWARIADGAIFDVRMLMFPGASSRGAAEFNRRSDATKSHIRADPQRQRYVSALDDVVQRQNYTPGTQRRCYSLLKHFFSALDDLGRAADGGDPIGDLRGVRDFVNAGQSKIQIDFGTTSWIVLILSKHLGIAPEELVIASFGHSYNNWVADFKGKSVPLIDFRLLCSKAHSTKSYAAFSRYSEAQKDQCLGDAARVAVVSAMRKAVNLKAPPPGGPTCNISHANCYIRLIRWFDGNNYQVNFDTFLNHIASHITDLKALYPASQFKQFSAALEAIEYPSSQSELLATVRNSGRVSSSQIDVPFWTFSFPNGDTKFVDTRKWLTKRTNLLPLSQYKKLQEIQKTNLISTNQRSQRIKKIVEYFNDKIITVGSKNTIITEFANFRAFLQFLDGSELQFGIDKDTACISAYSSYLSEKVKRNRINGETLNGIITRITAILAFGTTSNLAVLRQAAPTLDGVALSGRSGAYLASPDSKELLSWCARVVEYVSVETISKFHREQTFISIGKVKLRLPVSRSHPDFELQPEVANVDLVRFRIEAEAHRFCAVTSANKSLIQSLKLSEIHWDFDPKGYRIVKFKERRHGFLQLVVPKIYRPILERHIAFIEYLVERGAADTQLLFPYLVSDSPHLLTHKTRIGGSPQLRASESGAGGQLKELRAALSNAGVKGLTFKNLRFALGDFAHVKTDGDSLRTSRVLGNTPGVAYKSYGGSGNFPRAAREFPVFWAKAGDLRLSTLTPGLCSGTAPISLDDEFPADCGLEDSCFRCANYRSIETLDYVHAILSRIEVNRKRAAYEPLAVEKYNRVIRMSEDIVSDFLNRNPTLVGSVEGLRSRVGAGDLHDSFRNTYFIEAMIYGQ